MYTIKYESFWWNASSLTTLPNKPTATPATVKRPPPLRLGKKDHEKNHTEFASFFLAMLSSLSASSAIKKPSIFDPSVSKNFSILSSLSLFAWTNSPTRDW